MSSPVPQSLTPDSPLIKDLLAAFDQANRAVATAAADEKAFAAAPAKLSTAAAEAKQRLEQLTEELAKAQAQAEATRRGQIETSTNSGRHLAA